jgi:hypothetical protein
MALARTLRNDREKMGEHPMYRTSRGPGQLQSQSQSGADQYRVRRGEDPLAELARLIGQEDPFAEFNLKPRRAPANGNGHAPGKAVTPERRPNGNGAYNSHSNGYTNGHALQARGNGHEISRQPSSRYQPQPAPQPVRAPQERLPASRTARPAQQPQLRTNGASHAYQEQPRSPQARPNGRDATPRYAERNYQQPAEEYPEEDTRQTRRTSRDVRAPQGYVPEEAPRHARARPQQQPVQRDAYQRGYENDYDPEYADDAYLPDHADDIYGEIPRARRGIGFWIIAAIVLASLVAVAFLGVFAYRTVFNAPPRAAVITKSNAPTKVEPQKNAQQNAAAPNKTIQDRIAGVADQTQTLKREEQPVDLTTQNRQPLQFAPQQQQQQAPQKNAPAFTPPPQQQVPQATEQGPKKVKTITLRSDGAVQNNQQQNNAPLPLNANPPAAEEQETPPVQNRPNTNVPPANRNVASLGPTPTAQTNGNYIVQVASHKTPDEAQAAWQQLKTQHASIFGTRNADIRKVDLGDRGTFYRAMVGPMSRDQANALCQNLKTAGAGCIVQTRN